MMSNNEKSIKPVKKPKSGHAPVFSRRRLQYGSISIGLVVSFIAAIIILNMGVSFLTDRFYLKADITPTGVYEISDTSKILLGNLNMDIRIYVLLSEDTVINSTFYNVANEFIKRYQNLSGGRISIEYVDIYKNPGFLNNYDNSDKSIVAGSFIVETDLRYKVLKFSDIYKLSTNLNETTYETTQYVTGIDADQKLASAIQYVTARDLPTVIFLTGHNEEYGPRFKSIFTNSNYMYDECNLLLDEIPNDAAIIVMGLPASDYTPYEIEKLDNYLKTVGGNVICFTAVSSVQTPKLDEWLEEWGIGTKNQMALDTKRALFNSPVNVLADITDKTICKNLTISDTTYVMLPFARVLEQLWVSNNYRSTTVVLQSSASSYSKEYTTDTSFSSYSYENGDADGPFALGIMSIYGQTINSVSISSKLLVLSSIYMTSDTVLDIDALSNKNYLIGVVDYINPLTNVLNIEARDYYTGELLILTSQANVIFWILVVIIPVVILALGVYVWIKRRHR